MKSRLLIALAFAILAISLPSFGQIIDHAGDVIQISPPPSVLEGALISNDAIQAFPEKSKLLLGSTGVNVNISAGAGNAPIFVSTAQALTTSTAGANAYVNSYLLHANTINDTRIRFTASVKFDENILGLIVTENTLEQSDTLLGDGGVTYPPATSTSTDNGRGLEFTTDLDGDWVYISADRRTLLVSLVAKNKMDEIRVVTDASPDGGGELFTGCAGLTSAHMDISPGNSENWIRVDSIGGVRVAIFSRNNFDAPNCIFTSSLTFGHSGDEISQISCGVADFNADGFDDLVCDFAISKTGFTLSDTQGILKGRTVNSETFEFTDSITVVDASHDHVICCQPHASALQLAGQIVFSSQVKNTESTSVEIYNLLGQLMYKSGFVDGSRVLWGLSHGQNQPVVNGVYFYVVTVRTTEGKIIQSQVKAISILR
ncbi:hypothetical protein HY229_08815 [Candidatus Acetothermia bacterium]|nr:hypothetical protein [Candidatus Acetothermia bacterium]MBI3644182.1 hypothetical protein [Candidatus Acetothermia bacterium]